MSQSSDQPNDEQVVRYAWRNRVRFYEGGDGCHVEIEGIKHPHFYGNIPCNAWKKAAEWTTKEAYL